MKEESKRKINYFDFSELLNYYFRKKDPTHKTNLSLKMMHGVNKLSIIMFLIAVIVIISRRIF